MSEKRWPNSTFTDDQIILPKDVKWPNLRGLLTFCTASVKLKQLRLTVLLLGQVTKVFGLLYSVILQSPIRSSFFGHLD